MLTGKSLAELRLLCHFQNDRHEEIPKIINVNFHILADNYLRFIQFMFKYMFLRVTNTME